MLVFLVTVGSSQVSNQRPEYGGKGGGGERKKYSGGLQTAGCDHLTWWMCERQGKRVSESLCVPVVPSDADGAGSGRLLLLLIVVGVDVDLLCLLLQDLPEAILPDAAKERAHLVGLLDHPLQKTPPEWSSEELVWTPSDWVWPRIWKRSGTMLACNVPDCRCV